MAMEEAMYPPQKEKTVEDDRAHFGEVVAKLLFGLIIAILSPAIIIVVGFFLLRWLEKRTVNRRATANTCRLSFHVCGR